MYSKEVNLFMGTGLRSNGSPVFLIEPLGSSIRPHIVISSDDDGDLDLLVHEQVARLEDSCSDSECEIICCDAIESTMELSLRLIGFRRYLMQPSGVKDIAAWNQEVENPENLDLYGCDPLKRYVVFIKHPFKDLTPELEEEMLYLLKHARSTGISLVLLCDSSELTGEYRHHIDAICQGEYFSTYTEDCSGCLRYILTPREFVGY